MVNKHKSEILSNEREEKTRELRKIQIEKLEVKTFKNLIIV